MTTLSAQAVPTQKKSPSPGLRGEGSAASPDAPDSGTGLGGPGCLTSSLTRTGAHDEAHLTTHTTSAPLCGAWRAGVRRPRSRDGGVGRGEVDGVARPHHRIWAQMSSKRSRREPDHLTDPLGIVLGDWDFLVASPVLVLPETPAQA